MTFQKTVTGLRITPDAASSDDLLQLQSATGTTLVKVTSAGAMQVPSLASTTSATATLTTNADTGGLRVDTGAAANKGLIVKAAASQSANLQEWQDSTGTLLTSVTSLGRIYSTQRFSINDSNFTGLHTIFASSTSVVTSIIRAAASQTANLQEWQNSSGTILSRIDSSGILYPDSIRQQTNAANSFGGTTIAGVILSVKTSAAGNVGLIVQGATDQATDLARFRNSAATTLGGRNALAQMYTGSTSTLTQTTGGATTAASGDGTTATITTTSAHGLATGDLVTVAGVTPTGYNGTYLVTATPSSTQISYANATTGSQTVAGTVAAPAQLSVTARSAGTTGFIIKAAASQSANMQEWQISSGAVKAYISSTGSLVMGPNSTSYSYWGNASGNIVVRLQDAAVVGAIVKGAASQTADLQQWQNSAGSVLSYVTASGVIVGGAGFYTAASASSSFIAGSATTVPLIVKAAASQSSDLLSIRDSSDNVLAKFVSNGAFYGSLASLTGYVVINEANSGGRIAITKATAQSSNPGTGTLRMYVRDGTNAGTLKLVVIAGTAGAETTILDNIPQT